MPRLIRTTNERGSLMVEIDKVSTMAQCPVDHSSSSSTSSCSSDSPATVQQGGEKCPVDHSQLVQSADTEKCPVDHTKRSTWAGLFSSPTSSNTGSAIPPCLPTSREVSSIPRADAEGEKWVYPSEAQFFAAMARKQHAPRATDMRVVVPIHNAVNERAWGEVLAWENRRGGDQCRGVKLVSFKGRPNDRTPRAWLKTLFGYQAPFDRHDWVVDRCGTRMRYVIDFYTGKTANAGNVSFYLDVRPAFDNFEAFKMRTSRFVERWVGPLPWTNATTTNDSGSRSTTK